MPAQTLESPDEHPVASAGRAMVGVRVDPPGRGVDRVGVLARSEMRQAMLAGPLLADPLRRMEAGGVVDHGRAAEAAAVGREVAAEARAAPGSRSSPTPQTRPACKKGRRRGALTPGTPSA